MSRENVLPAHRSAQGAAASWERDRPVARTLGAVGLVVALTSLRALAALRTQVREHLVAGCGAASGVAKEDAVERAVLVIDELTSNALRHGTAPSSLQVCDEPEWWLVIVRDAAPLHLPQLAVGRPAGQGGYGLHVIADLASDHGVHYATDHKLVWARLDRPASTTA